MPTVPKSELRVPKPPPGRRLRARDALRAVAIAALLLLLFEGTSLRKAGEQMQPGWERSVVLAVGKPAGWVADLLPLHKVHLFAWISPSGEGAAGGSVGSGPHTLLVTGDSLAMPLDVELARGLAGKGFRVLRDPHIGTGVSKSGLVDWRKLSSQQARRYRPDAVVVFIGANEGFPMPGPGGRQVQCCGRDWTAVYASRVRRIVDTYRQGGRARVYWLNLPLPRERARQEIARAVNEAIDAAVRSDRSRVRLLDMAAKFTPAGRYRDAMSVHGRERIVRDSDGIHLNETGAELATEAAEAAIRGDFGR